MAYNMSYRVGRPLNRFSNIRSVLANVAHVCEHVKFGRCNSCCGLCNLYIEVFI